MKIRIGHLYYNILNLYGTHSEVTIIKKQLEFQGIEVIIDQKEINEDINFNDYDFIYLGASTDYNMFMCLDDLKKYRNDIRDYLKNKVIYSSGNSINMFGKSIDDIEALQIFDFKSTKLNKRIISEVVLKHKDINEPIIGVFNQSYVLDSNNNYIFKLIYDIENYPISFEGYENKGFIGTNIIGPIVCRNPYFTEYLVNKIIKSKYPNFIISEYNLKEEKDAYNYFMYRFHNSIRIK